MLSKEIILKTLVKLKEIDVFGTKRHLTIFATKLWVSKKFSISLIFNIDQDNRSMYTGHLSSYIILERDLLLNIKGLNSK